VYEYLLFVDTETSGLPRDWDKPYAAEGNWPYIVQIAWLLCDRQGNELKRENHYILPADYQVSEKSRRIHGISDSLLQKQGQRREEVMQLLYDDLIRYKPLLVSHFMQLDYHMLSLGLQRAGLPNPLPDLPVFCTMLLTRRFALPMERKYLRLNELYRHLFAELMENQHDALADALATARCFFYMQQRGDISPRLIEDQAKEHHWKRSFMKSPRKRIHRRNRAFIWIGILFFLIALLISLFFYAG
jgi:DNA polymerase-3 subunit epsilon